jgi:hypothetical protein
MIWTSLWNHGFRTDKKYFNYEANYLINESHSSDRGNIEVGLAKVRGAPFSLGYAEAAVVDAPPF